MLASLKIFAVMDLEKERNYVHICLEVESILCFKRLFLGARKSLVAKST